MRIIGILNLPPRANMYSNRNHVPDTLPKQIKRENLVFLQNKAKMQCICKMGEYLDDRGGNQCSPHKTYCFKSEKHIYTVIVCI